MVLRSVLCPILHIAPRFEPADVSHVDGDVIHISVQTAGGICPTKYTFCTYVAEPVIAGNLNCNKSFCLATDYLGLKPKVEIKMAPPVPLWKLAAASGPYVKLAAISGAAAVILGAVGSHRYYSKDEVGKEQRRIFETANRYHFIHTLALLGLPLCRFPTVAATFILSGIILFCGSCYYTAFIGDRRFSTTTPIGGFCFILAWCSMFF